MLHSVSESYDVFAIHSCRTASVIQLFSHSEKFVETAAKVL